jgi:enterochelin esterase-like enzyme
MPERTPRVLRLDAPGMGRPMTVAVLPPLRPAAVETCLPVLVMPDAQDLFHGLPARGFDGAPIDGALAAELEAKALTYPSWHVAPRLDAAIAAGDLPPMLVVAVFSDDGVRSAELAPWSWPAAMRPLGPALADWILDGLLPRLARDWPLCRGPGAVSVAGSSLGGTFALWFGLARPEAVGRVLALSPLVGTATFRAPFEALAGRARLPRTSRVVVDLGWREPAYADPRVVDDLLAAAGLPAARRSVIVSLGGRHTPDSWGERFLPGLRLLFAEAR